MVGGAGCSPPQAPFGPLPWSPVEAQQRDGTILRNPARGRHPHLPRRRRWPTGTWAPVLPRETWEAVRAPLDASDRTIVDKNGKPRRVRARTERGVRTLLGGLALCRCGNTVQGSVSSDREAHATGATRQTRRRPAGADHCPVR